MQLLLRSGSSQVSRKVAANGSRTNLVAVNHSVFSSVPKSCPSLLNKESQSFRYVCRAAPEGAPAGSQTEKEFQPLPEDQGTAQIRDNVERAAQMLNEMLNEILGELFAENATAYIQDEKVSVTEEEAVRKAVVSRIEFLDANFLAAVNGFIQVVGMQKDQEQLLTLLIMLRDEVLQQVSFRLPPTARVLNRVLQEADKDKRVTLLRVAFSGGRDELPGTDAPALMAATSQFIDDMEEQLVIPDRQLLARLCVLREEIRLIELETGFSSTAAAADFARANVPQRCAAFLKELTAVSDQTQRVSLIHRAFTEDWDGAAPKQKPDNPNPEAKDQPDFVRPGRFMTTLHSMITELKAQEAAAGGEKAVQKRLREIQMESLAVLDRMQRRPGANQAMVL